MDQLTMALVEDGTPAAARAKTHTEQANRGISYNEMRKQEMMPIQLRLGQK